MKLFYSVLCLLLVVLTSCGDDLSGDTLSGVECADSEELCDGVCRDTQSDSFACGACGLTCVDGWFCRSGECAAPPLSSCPTILDDSVIGTSCNNEGLSCGGCSPCINCYLIECLDGEWVGGEIFGSEETCRNLDGDDHYCNADNECTNECSTDEDDPCPESHACVENICMQQGE